MQGQYVIKITFNFRIIFSCLEKIPFAGKTNGIEKDIAQQRTALPILDKTRDCPLYQVNLQRLCAARGIHRTIHSTVDSLRDNCMSDWAVL